MKQSIISVLCVLMLVFATSCGTTRKTAKLEAQTHVEAIVNNDTHTQKSTSDAITQRVTETDLSNIVIDFTKVEYTDGTSDITTTKAQTDAPLPKQRDREQTEPPNENTKSVKSIISGRATINNDKKRQEDTTKQSVEATKTDTSQKTEISQDTQTKTQTKEEPRHLSFWLGLTIGIIVVIALFALVLKIRKYF